MKKAQPINMKTMSNTQHSFRACTHNSDSEGRLGFSIETKRKMVALQYLLGAIVTAVLGFLLFLGLLGKDAGKKSIKTQTGPHHHEKQHAGILKVHGQPASVCTARVTASLEEKGIPYELVPISFPTGEHKKQPYLSKNPFGQVPAFQDGDLVIFESRAISRYVARKYKSKGTDLLRLHSIKESAVVDVWMEVESQQYNPAIAPIVMQSVIIPKYGGVADEKLIASSAEKLGKVLDVYEARLSETKYLAGDFFSLADLHHLPLTSYLMVTPHASLITSRPHVKAWWEDISSRPASKKVTAKMFGK